jgi:hypothetical protein
MLNPSIANQEINDPTVERCQKRAFNMGLGGIEVVNIFALVSTDPGALYASQDPVGELNDKVIVSAAEKAEMIICAWGVHGKYRYRGKEVEDLLRRSFEDKLFVLGLNYDGTPKHPLYLSYKKQPERWR